MNSPTLAPPVSLNLLPRHDWVTDYGYRRHMNQSFARGDLGDYFQAEKSHKTLLELLVYMSEAAERATCAYFELPANTVAFLRWAWDRVAWKGELPEGTSNQMLIFPYRQLYHIWQVTPDRGESRRQNTLVSAEGITDAAGIRYAPTYHEVD